MIVINVDVMLAKRKMSVTELSNRVGITMANISILKNGKAKAIKLETLNKNVDELVTMQMPYGEADERYDRLTNYLNRANVIHFQISKTVGAPTFFDTISSIDKEKYSKTTNKSIS